RIEIYAGVNPKNREKALKAICETVEEFRKGGITEAEFMRGKEQIKSAFIMSQESTSSQMQIYGKSLLQLGEVYDFEERIKKINAVTLEERDNLRTFRREKGVDRYRRQGRFTP
ncbi:MAG: insulinase family protein, partial [Clostridia bacterium]|nr:insulinase family protein [Clostridia bacterium]